MGKEISELVDSNYVSLCACMMPPKHDTYNFTCFVWLVFLMSIIREAYLLCFV